MGLIEQAKADWNAITGNANEFGVAMTFEAPTSETAAVVGLHTKHHLNVSPEGTAVSGKNAHVSVSEKLLTDLSYPVRNAAGEVSLKGHKVTVKDSTGGDKIYKIREWYPDETIGVLVCILTDFE
jgi:hypothetical protein